MKLDQRGIDFIKGFEKLCLTPYLDEAGVWTIGWGHTDGVTEDTPQATQNQCEIFFREDVEPCEQLVTKSTNVPLTQSEFNSLVSFTFNEGLNAFLTSTLLAKLNSGDKQGAAKEFDRWIYYTTAETQEKKISNGLINRRAKEKVLFLSDFEKTRSIPELPPYDIS